MTGELIQSDYISGRLFPSCRLTLGVMGLFGSLFINLMRNNLSVGIVCMTIDDDDTDQNATSKQNPWVSILFPNYRRSRHSLLNEEDEICPGEVSSEGYGEVICGQHFRMRQSQLML